VSRGSQYAEKGRKMELVSEAQGDCVERDGERCCLVQRAPHFLFMNLYLGYSEFPHLMSFQL
jgi:hypothetical protein